MRGPWGALTKLRGRDARGVGVPPMFGTGGPVRGVSGLRRFGLKRSPKAIA